VTEPLNVRKLPSAETGATFAPKGMRSRSTVAKELGQEPQGALDVRIAGLCWRTGIKDIRTLSTWSDEEIMELGGIGEIALLRIRDYAPVDQQEVSRHQA
jgi:hypothetical protein